MKSAPSHTGNGNDPDFDALLRSAAPRTPLPDNFHHGVWRRIEATGDESVPGHIRRCLTAMLVFLSGPLPAAGAVTLMVAAGLWLGARAADARGKSNYVTSISPFAEAHRSDSDE